MDWFVSDPRPLFKNQLGNLLATELRVKHHFTTSYSPRAERTVEQFCKEIIQATQALCCEWKLPPREWPNVTECLWIILNPMVGPIKRLGLGHSDWPVVYGTPVKIFTVHLTTRPLMLSLPLEKYKEARSVDEI